VTVPATPTAITTTQAQLAVMTQGSGSPFASLKCVLFTNNVAPAPSSVLVNFTLATFGGYAAAAVTFNNAYIGSDGLIHVTFSSALFVATGSGLPQTVYGYGLTNTAGTVWVGGALLATPFNLQVASDAVPITPDVVYGF
jgi:hypothetical protein